MTLTPLDNSHITRPLMMGLGVLTVFLAGWVVGSGTSDGPATISLTQERQFNELDKQNRQLSDEVHLLTAQRYSDEQTIRDLQTDLTDLRLTRSRERQELVMFRNLAKAGDDRKGIAIDAMTISDLGQQRFSIEWRLTQPRGRKRVSGDQTVVIEGTDAAGEYRSINIGSLTLSPKAESQDSLAQGAKGAQRDSDSGATTHDQSYSPSDWIDRQVSSGEGVELLPDAANDLLESGSPLSPQLAVIASGLGRYPDFDFRYLENFVVTVEVPDDFTPEMIGFAVEPESAYSPTIKPVAKLFPWRIDTDVDASNE